MRSSQPAPINRPDLDDWLAVQIHGDGVDEQYVGDAEFRTTPAGPVEGLPYFQLTKRATAPPRYGNG